MIRALCAIILFTPLAAVAQGCIAVEVEVRLSELMQVCSITTNIPGVVRPERPIVDTSGASWAHGYRQGLPQQVGYFILEALCETDAEGYETCREALRGWDGQCGGTRCFLGSEPLANPMSVCAVDHDQGSFVCSAPWHP